MTIITAKLYKSGTSTPLSGNITVSANSQLYAADKTYVTSAVVFPLMNGEANMELIASDLQKVSYNFRVYENVSDPTEPLTLLYSFDASIPDTNTPLNFNTLAPSMGLRYDLRDSSLLTLARYLVSADPFINFLGSKLWANKGQWSASVVYRRGDVVLYAGSSYQCIDNTQVAGLVPQNTPNKWTLLVSANAGLGSTPVGGMLMYPTGASLPTKFLRCQGQAVSRSTYSTLFAVIGTSEGAGDGSTTFNVPTSPIAGYANFLIYTGV